MFNGKNVVITGGSRGIGFATAKIFAEANANVLITGRNEEALKNACAEIGRNYSTLQVFCIVVYGYVKSYAAQKASREICG